MASQSAPSTPTTVALQTVQSNSPTGNWQHPRFDEINKRLQQSTFSERNVKQILWRAFLLVVYFFSKRLNASFRWLTRVDPSKMIYTQLPSLLRLAITTLLPLLLLAYALFPLRPLFTNPDELSDVPLTPQQRSLLGLKPSSQPATPGSQYITPPRYSRSATPRSGNSSASGSPFSGKGSPVGSGMPGPSYSPNASPLFQKAMGRDGSRRFSYGSPSPLGIGRPAMDSSSSLASQLTNSPSVGKGASVGLNSRWLYERGRRSSSGLRTGFS